MNPLWRYYLPGYLFALPLTVFGLLMALYYRPKSAHLSDGCIEFVMPAQRNLIGGVWVAGQTFGNVIFYRSDSARASRVLRGHERVHTWQAMVWTAPGLMLSYGISALANIRRIRKDVRTGYRYILAERQAYEVGEEIRTGPELNYWGKP